MRVRRLVRERGVCAVAVSPANNGGDYVPTPYEMCVSFRGAIMVGGHGTAQDSRLMAVPWKGEQAFGL